MAKVEIKTNPERLKPLIIGNKVFRSAYDYELSSEDMERARLELNETEDVRKDSLRTLKEMLSRDNIKYRTDDDYLLCFLRCKKFNCKEAYKTIHFIYCLKKDYPHVFSSLPPNLKPFMDSKMLGILPYRDEEGSPIFLDKFGKWNPEEKSVFDLFQFTLPLTDIIFMNPCTQINKCVVIMDFEGTKLSYVPAALSPSVLMFWTKAWQNLYPYRLKSILIVNCNKLTYLTLKAVRYLLKKKISDRIILCSDISELHQHINPALLPKEYGGSLDEEKVNFTDHIMDNLAYSEYAISFHKSEKL